MKFYWSIKWAFILRDHEARLISADLEGFRNLQGLYFRQFVKYIIHPIH